MPNIAELDARRNSSGRRADLRFGHRFAQHLRYGGALPSSLQPAFVVLDQ